MKYGLVILILVVLINDKESFTDPRDQQTYTTIQIGELLWMKENLKFRTENSIVTIDGEGRPCEDCGKFYPVQEAVASCPAGWRLPTTKEVKSLIKLDKKGKISLSDTLQIKLCGRHDDGMSGRFGEQNTFWIDAELVDGSIPHWHTFGRDHSIHDHNVVEAQRKFPVRCVCEVTAE